MTDLNIRELYHVVISAMVPAQSGDTVAARSEKHAREIILEKYKKYSDLKIIDVFKIKDCPEIVQAQKEEVIN